MDDNKAELLIKVLESIDGKFETLRAYVDAHLGNITKQLQEIAVNVHALRITSLETPATPAPKARVAEVKPKGDFINNARVVILDGQKHYWKRNDVVCGCFYPAIRTTEDGRELFVKLAVRQDLDDAAAPACGRFTQGDALVVCGKLEASEWNGKKRTTLWANDIAYAADANTPAAPTEPAADTGNEEEDDIPF